MNQLSERQLTSPRTGHEVAEAEVTRLRHGLSDKLSTDELIDAAEILLSAYPHARPTSPQKYLDSIVVHLAKYPRFLTARIVDMANGVCTRTSFPPVCADIEKFAKPIWERACRDLQDARDMAKQLAPPERQISVEDREYVAAGLKGLAKGLNDEMNMRRAFRPRMRAPHCASGDAIRASMGLSNDGG